MTDYDNTKKLSGTPPWPVHFSQEDIAMSNVVRLKGYLAPPRPRRQRQKSQYERYPMPFFNRKTRCTWDVKPTGDYFADCETGKAYALEFLKSCDGTVGWTSLLPQIASDMISAGPQEPPLPGGFQNPGGTAYPQCRLRVRPRRIRNPHPARGHTDQSRPIAIG